ncbi:hypothetical protein ABN273_49465, partial [Nonomuraea sp. B19D2]
RHRPLHPRPGGGGNPAAHRMIPDAKDSGHEPTTACRELTSRISVGYKSPHNDPRGVLPQQHLPDELADRVYYQPTAHGNERAVGERLDKIRRITRGT